MTNVLTDMAVNMSLLESSWVINTQHNHENQNLQVQVADMNWWAVLGVNTDCMMADMRENM